MNKKYQIIYADPPWKFGSKQYRDGGRTFQDIEEKYNTMHIEDIEDIDINSITDNDCACFMWSTDAHLKEAINLLEKWGFAYKTIAFVWLKKYNTGTTVVKFAPWTLKSTEICLLGIKGKMGKYKKSNKVRQFVEAERTIHSRKPDEVRDRIVKLFGDLPRIELFAREDKQLNFNGKTIFDGWDVWGNEVKSDIKLKV